MKLSHVDLGAPAAERDIERGLQQYFVESEAYRRVADRTKTIIIGNRGAGKSAIFQMLAKKAKSQGTRPHGLIDVLWRIGFLRAQAVSGIKGHVRSGSTYLGAYQVATLSLNRIKRFQIHPMFRTYLGTREAKGS
jgi:hypothetical protein